MCKKWILPLVLGTLAGCGDDIVRVFPLSPAASLPHGHSSLVAGTLIAEMEDSEALLPGYRWVAWVRSDAGAEVLGEMDPDTRLEVDVSGLTTAAASIEEILVTEEETGATLPANPSTRIWLHGEFPGALHALGLDEAAFAAASAQVTLEKKHVEVQAAGLPALPAGFHYDVWLQLEADHGDEHSTDVAPMPTAVGRLGGGAFLENDLDTLAVTALSAMVTIESERGVAMMSSATALHGEVALSGDPSAAPAAAEPPGHMH